MKMKLNALSLAVAAGFIGSAAQAADVAMFPYVVNSPTVTTIVTIVDRGNAATPRYNASGVAGIAGALGNRLHWRLNYKANADATNNVASCSEVNYFLPTSSNDIQSVDISGKFGSTTKGVLFSDPSVNNGWNAGTSATINYMLGKAAGVTQRGLLFVHNADGNTAAGDTAVNSVYGEAMILDFSTGAAWGYQAVTNNSGAAHTALTAFDFAAASVSVPSSNAAINGVVTFQPPAETTTRLFVTPMPAAGAALLTADGANAANWEQLQTTVSMATNTGVAFDRDENLVSGSANADVRCVGAVDATSLMTSGAQAVLANGGWGNLTLANPTALPVTYTATTRAYVTKLEFNSGAKFNGEAVTGTFNNGFILR